MIGRLYGVLTVKQPPALLVDVHGVGYELEAPMSTFYQLPEVGVAVTLHTHLVVREDAHLLYGFATLMERSLFRDLLRVNGVGPRLALTILSGIDAAGFARCITENDATTLTRLPGVGKKTAERLVIEMRDRVGAWQTPLATPGVVPLATKLLDPADDAVSALIALGYRPPEASRLVQAVQGEGLSTEDLIRRALQSTLRAGGRT
ncbi:Holliday junction branch migration complex subunit RuvA [Gammaproteobacteria bacterium]